MVVSVLRLALLTIAGHLWAGLRFVAGYSPVRKDLHCPASGSVHSDLALEVRGSLNSLCVGECLTCGRGRELSLRSWGSLRAPLGKGCWWRVGCCMTTILPDSDTVHISPVLTLPNCPSGNVDLKGPVA